PIRLHSEYCARLHGSAIHQDSARTAISCVASHVGSGEIEMLTNELDQQNTWLDCKRATGSVDFQRDRNFLDLTVCCFKFCLPKHRCIPPLPARLLLVERRS